MSGTGGEGGAGAGSGAGAGAGAGAGTGAGGGAGAGFTAITIDSQAALDTFLSNQDTISGFLAPRLDRKEQAVRTKIAEALGTTPDKLDEHIAGLKKLQQEHETDAQRREREAREAAATETEGKVRGEFDGKISAAKTRLIRADVIAEAQKLGFSHPEDVWALVRDSDKLSIDDEFVVKGVETVVKKIAGERPEWIGGTSTFRGSPPAGTGGGPPGANAERQKVLAGFQEDRLGRLSGGRRTRL